MPIAVKSIALPTFPEGLFKGLGTIRQSNIGQNNPYGRKYYVLNLALAQFYDYRERSAQTAYTLSDADCKIYNVDSGIPGYFAYKFDQTKIQEIYVSSKEDYHYDFDSSYEFNSMAFWLDFADQKLGGGVFGQGFLQEERMCCETPDLANAAAVGIETRTGGPEVLKGSPTPVAITGVHRVLDTKNIHDLKNDPNPTLMELYLDLKKYITPVQPLEFNVLAIAVPKLSAKESKPQLLTLQDLFNTFVSGFHLAAELAAGSPNTKRAAINTGPIGTGDFNNNKYVVWVLQLLAASQKGVNLHFWGCNKDEDCGAREDLEKILKEFTNNGHTTIAQLLDDASKVTWPHY